jgi:hypothetical protein
MIKRKLLRTERTINVYQKNPSPHIENPIDEINIDVIPLEKIKIIVVAKPDDPLLYDGYELNMDQINNLNKYLEKPIIYDFNRFEYFLECYGIYDANSE